MRLRHGQVLRCTVEDADGKRVGRVIGTAPADGGGEPELVLIQLGGRFGRRRWVTLAGATWSPGRLRLPVVRDAVEDAPCAQDARWGDPPDVARAFWRTLAEV